MANRERKNELKKYLSDDEQYIPEQKVKASGMKSKSAFLRRQILYGFVYDIDYSNLREYNAALGKIGGNLNIVDILFKQIVLLSYLKINLTAL